MELKSTWHLCQKCKDEPWEQDPVNRSKNDLERKKPFEERRRCGNCKKTPEHACFFLCHYHASKAQLCQRCNKTTLTEEEQVEDANLRAEQEIFEAAIDFFTLLTKRYGVTEAWREVYTSRIWDENILAKLNELITNTDYPGRFTPKRLDSRVHRPLWRYVLAGKAIRYCENCSPPPQFPVAISRALNSECGHLVVGGKAEWCALCAADRFVCEICGVSVK